jgi:transposase
VKDQANHTSENTEFITLSRGEYDTLLNFQTEVVFLKHELEKLKRMIFGSKSERFVPVDNGQLNLGLEGLETQQTPEVKTETLTYTRNKNTKSENSGHSRMPLPAHLPRVDHVIEPDTDITGAKKIGEEITEILEYKPGKLYVERYIRNKYALPQEQGIVIGNLPSLPIPRGNAGAGLLSHLIISKYVDHLPFYRQVQQFKRQGVMLAESTINDWFSATCKLISPLYDELKKKVLSASYLMADETPIPVLTEDKPGATHKGYLWVYFSPIDRQVLFDYRQRRSGEGPKSLLQNYRGLLQTDGYDAYKYFEQQPGITLLACMAHARRKFDEAINNDKVRAEQMLKMIQELYAIERRARADGLSYEQRKVMRQEESLPVLTAIEAWLKENLQQVLPKSAIGKAIAYTLTLWPRLLRYVEHGEAEIDNNLIENSIRPVAIGRKNYMFAGSHHGAERAAMMYSLLGTCKQNNIEPFTWLKEVLTRLPDHSIQRLEELLPQNLIIPAEQI